MNRVVVITGMHRSGASFVANVLNMAGVFIGEKLIGANKGNIRGHFEDLDFFSFHENILESNQKTFLVQNIDGLGAFSQADHEKADQLIAERAHIPVWGWKDPRTSLFLEFWNEKLPQANFVLLYRHPVAVAHSLVRRGAVYPENDAYTDLNAWRVYNQQIFNFARLHPGKSILCHIDRVTQDLSGFIEQINRKFELTLDEKIDTSVFYPEELHRNPYPPPMLEAIRSAVPQVFGLYERLEEIADLREPRQAAISPAEQEYASALRGVIQRQLAGQEDAGVRLNYLFTLLDPNLANNRAARINELLIEQRKFASDAQWLLGQVAEREAAIEALNASVREQNTTIQGLIGQVRALSSQLTQVALQLQQNDALIQSLRTQLNAMEHVHQVAIDELSLSQDEATAYALSRSWQVTRPMRKKFVYLRNLAQLVKNIRPYLAIRRSGLFDAHFYLKNYPDVRQADVDPLLHFVTSGGQEGRSPSAAFDAGLYLSMYSDVASSGANPLLHYLRHGKAEGRYVQQSLLNDPGRCDPPIKDLISTTDDVWLDEAVLEAISNITGHIDRIMVTAQAGNKTKSGQ